VLAAAAAPCLRAYGSAVAGRVISGLRGRRIGAAEIEPALLLGVCAEVVATVWLLGAAGRGAALELPKDDGARFCWRLDVEGCLAGEKFA
jgi:hypothetical protein